MAKILLIVAHEGFQPKEFEEPKRILEEAGHLVVVGSDALGVARSSTGDHIPVDVALPQVRAVDYDGIYVIGGPGCLTHLDNSETYRVMKEARDRADMPYGAICIAPRILAKAGVLSGVRSTGWNQDGKLESICENGVCTYQEEPVVIDGRVITADGPNSAAQFGEEIRSMFAKST